MTPAPYRYFQLESARHVRLLNLQWPKTSTLQALSPSFSIIHASLDHIPQYVTLSYAWGPYPRTDQLQLDDGSYILVTPTLKADLCQISDHARNHGFNQLWIDQICIDQENMSEREQQVRLMREVYQTSSLACIWLGGIDKHTSELIELVRAMEKGDDYTTGYRIIVDGLPVDTYPEPELRTQDRIKAREMHVRPLLSPVDASGTTLTNHEESFFAFFERPWFRRAWVFQEAVLPEEIKFCIGHESFTHHRILNIARLIGTSRIHRILAELTRESPAVVAGYEVLFDMDDARLDHAKRRRFQGFHYRDYPYFLSEVANRCQTTDMRDLCYAFLGLNNDERIVVSPQYGISITEVFTSTTRSIIEGTSSLDIFTALTRGASQIIDDDLPSWVPDWSAMPKTEPLYTRVPHQAPRTFAKKIFRACGAYMHRSVSFGPQLLVKGKIADIVSWVSIQEDHDSEFQNDDIPRLLKLNDIHSELQQNFAEGDKSFGSERLLKVLIAEGANAGGNEPILQDEAAQGLAEWRLRELVRTYNHVTLNPKVDASAYPPEEYEEQLNVRALAAYGRVAWNRKVFLTEKSLLGLAPLGVRQDDSVCILHGSMTPVVLRRQDKGWRVIGQCYVESAMKGEAVTWQEDEGDDFLLS